MKRKGKFKVLVVIIIGIILLVIPITMQAKGEVSKNVLDKYVVIGDEISLEANNDYEVSYVSLIKDFLYALNDNLEYINLSSDGATSSQLLNVVDSNKEKLKDADLITISIGGNNILSAVLKSLNINEENLQDYDENKFDSIISEYLNSKEVKTEILNEISIFSKDFPNIIKKIKKLAPNADIYVNTVYNPINKKCEIYEFFDSQINLINDVIVKNNSNNDYKILDCYQILNNDDVLNFKIENGVAKISPNKVGHAMMANQVISDYEEYVNLEVDKITSTSNNIKGKTIPNTNIIVVSENGTVGTTQAKSNGEFEVKISPMVSGTNIEVLVYDKKIFSILYKFEKLVVKKDLFTS
ncbi:MULTISPECIES: GDSL-type esterase/lipase family protein [unclassified Clostridium]|uniref:GDSL-type esterase/lipase family protein n=1 Tax=Clostridium TaxID=1485 RepID=UPI001C8BCECB|nr:MULTISPECIES: GDSL-type esterase/lipase family protein [unclassified Clostridium]MBX9137936.1 SGNH/GDSL hydrolase family protein [Clostridium sp. K12(2020)]MBX9144709.1 SGNH/GDSL hydrolase family protein [Clostridium sp. K13]MDU2291985.1 GDSL-type esterase/lipase family protein [Clostridium celatum]MDU4326585.1 GDSL-type esterase/lipase family protein [Clostridium celatum]